MQERRKNDRKYLTYFSRVVDRSNGLFLGYLVDMTTGGALMIGSIPLKVNSDFHLRIDLPERFAPQVQLDFDAKAVWSMPDTDPELYRTGLQLKQVEPRDLLTLEKLLSSYGLQPE
jgi:hypothetical protein